MGHRGGGAVSVLGSLIVDQVGLGPILPPSCAACDLESSELDDDNLW